jgi:hypothetical protein
MIGSLFNDVKVVLEYDPLKFINSYDDFYTYWWHDEPEPPIPELLPVDDTNPSFSIFLAWAKNNGVCCFKKATSYVLNEVIYFSNYQSRQYWRSDGSQYWTSELLNYRVHKTAEIQFTKGCL